MGEVCEVSNSVRSLVNPALQLGKQIGGGSGCFALAGSGGTGAALTGTGGKAGRVDSQALSSISIGSSISNGLGEAFFVITIDLPVCRDAALELGGLLLLRLEGGHGHLALVLGRENAGLGVRPTLAAQVVGLSSE